VENKEELAQEKIKQLEKELREKENRFATIIGISSDAIIMTNQGMKIIFFNHGAEQIFGYSASEMVGKEVNLLIPDRFLGRHREQVQSFYEGSETARLKGGRGTGIVGLRKDGSEFPAEASISKGMENGEVIYAVILRDVSERKRAEDILREEHEKLIVTLRSIGDGVIVTDGEGRVVLMNPVAEMMTGWKESEALNSPIREIFHIFREKTRQIVENPVEKVLEEGNVVRLANHTVLKSKEGTERPISDSAAPIQNQEGETMGAILVFRDETERYQMQDEVLKAMKLESIGLLAGGIAHDFNNTLTAILGNISLAKMNMAPNSYSYKRLDETEKATMKAKDLAYQLLTFSKGGVPRKTVMSIVELIKESTHFSLSGSNVRAEFFFSHNLWAVDIDETQMSQVINNLVINAIQAMPQGGLIVIQAQNAVLQEEAKRMHLPMGNFVNISVKDNGKGIQGEHLKKIFDPFFTTKEKGTGLGLYSTYTIIKNHGGNILVSSTEGAGTTFSIYIPSLTEVLPEKKESEGKIFIGSGRVLVVDDDPLVRSVAGEMLQNLGYEVDHAASGEEGIVKYKEAQASKRPFDVLILDLTMPGGIGGKETFQKLLEIDTGVRAIVSSGYSEDPAIKNYREFGFKEYLAKPYRIGTLSAVLKRVLSNK
jgi:PAS domain S-box-containing protein